MKSLLILKRVTVENANAISGLIYGFPSVTHFLGYVHSLSRELHSLHSVELGGCGIISHSFDVRAYRASGWGDQVFSLSKNPLGKDGGTPSFNEEGKVHMEISLIIECNFTSDDFDLDVNKFEELLFQLALKRRLAGGIITKISSVEFVEIPEDEEKVQPFFKKIYRKLLPGFVLQDRMDILKKYLGENPHINPLEALLDFYVLKSKSEPAEDGVKKSWESMPKPAGGWLVPLQSGYKAISPLYKEGEVACARDKTVPFRFVEALYGLGEWVGLHRIKKPETIFWHYHNDNDMYLCKNNVN